MDPFYVVTMIVLMLTFAGLIVAYAPDPMQPPPPGDDQGDDLDDDLDYFGPEDQGDYWAGGRP